MNFLARECYGIESRIAYSGVIGRRENRAMVSILRIPVHRLRPGDLKKYKQIALVDTQPSFTNNSFPKNRKAAIVIDQHRRVDRIAVRAFHGYGVGKRASW